MVSKAFLTSINITFRLKPTYKDHEAYISCVARNIEYPDSEIQDGYIISVQCKCKQIARYIDTFEQMDIYVYITYVDKQAYIEKDR